MSAHIIEILGNRNLSSYARSPEEVETTPTSPTSPVAQDGVTRGLTKAVLTNRTFAGLAVVAGGYSTARINFLPGIPLPLYAGLALAFAPWAQCALNESLRETLGENRGRGGKAPLQMAESLSLIALGLAEVGGTCLATAAYSQDKTTDKRGLLIAMGVLYGVAFLLQAGSTVAALRVARRRDRAPDSGVELADL